MRFIMTIFWAVLISAVLSYVLNSMASEPFNPMHSLVLAGIFTLAVIVLGEGVLTERED